jgi:hypothetical protein
MKKKRGNEGCFLSSINILLRWSKAKTKLSLTPAEFDINSQQE